MSTVLGAPVVLRPRWGWQEDAACYGKPYEWFLGDEEHPLTSTQARPGRAVCFSCSVRRDCLLEALLVREKAGLRGGYLSLERSRALARHKGSVEAAMRDDELGRFLVRRA